MSWRAGFGRGLTWTAEGDALARQPLISVVIPVLNEEARIGSRLDELANQSGLVEVVVVDGGSTDGTRSRVTGREGVRLIEAERGRASQLNAGAAVATGEVLLFLHADVALPSDAARWVHAALRNSEVVAGAFRTWTVSDLGPSRLGPLLHLADIRSRYSGLPYGDQALFVRRAAFAQAGGYPAQPLMEDLELSRRLRRLGQICTVPARVQVSGRRFLARPIAYTLAVNVFPALYALGVSPARLKRLYGDPR
jgi:rSAM/selenodomain-associated transferase 2